MSVWYCIPSKRRNEEAGPVIRQWQERGYKVAVQRDHGDGYYNDSDEIIMRRYSGYAEAVNCLVLYVLDIDPAAEWFVTGGDDILPDPNHSAEEIARECSVTCGNYSDPAGPEFTYSTFGVMQPTGDDFGANPNHADPAMRGSYISRVAGSPWMGREWCRRINGGKGPLWPEYFHCGEDEELQAVAQKYGVFWQRPDLVHHHEHWGRPKPGERMAPSSRMPDFLARANSPTEWQKYKALFAKRKAAGFPGSEPII